MIQLLLFEEKQFHLTQGHVDFKLIIPDQLSNQVTPSFYCITYSNKDFQVENEYKVKHHQSDKTN